MTATLRSTSLGRSIWAILAGLLINIIPAVAIDIVLHRARVFPPIGQRMTDGMCLLASSYRYLLGFMSGYVVARLAPANPRKHVLILGGIGVAMGSAGAIAMWNAGPPWYPLALIILAIPLALAGEYQAVLRLAAKRNSGNADFPHAIHSISTLTCW